MERFSASNVSISNGSIKYQIGKSSFPINLPLNSSVLPLQTLTMEVSSLFIHYLIRIWTTCWWNLNNILWSEIYEILSILVKIWGFDTIFDWALMPFWKTFLYLKQLVNAKICFEDTIFHRSKITAISYV